MKSFKDMNPYLIGLVSVFVIGTATAFAFLVGIRHLGEKAYPIRAVFSDASGIRVGDDVRVAGVKSGRVTKVVADREAGAVVVDMKVGNGVDLGPDTKAEIALETLLGTKFVRLSGPVVKPYLRTRPEAQRLIPRDRTKTPFDVFELTKIGTRTIQETETEKVNKFITELADITEGKQDTVRQLLDGITRLSTALNDRDAQLRELLDRADTLSGNLAAKDQTLVQLIDQSQVILDYVQRRRTAIAGTLESSAEAVTELGRLITVNQASLDSILTTLHPTLGVVEKHQADIAKSLGVLGQGSLGLARASTHGPWQDIYVREVGASFICLLSQQSGNPVPGC
ncbi:MAG: phospholipid/cholesterol/gamma-HCH transport system substrate-binding protein [Acidimicrobiaceae bacterium]|nr:phospholipid/cholesterol/gamma-HCH transport system substrate-binding protein [Acidimicrobiaceae bacterium]